MATSGLAWTITPETDNDITVSPTSGSGDVTLEFSASDNAGSERMGTFIVSLDANQERTVTITATQTGKDTGAYIGNLQVCLTDEDSSNFGTANTNCSKSTKEGKTGWRLPTKDELIIMSNNKNTLQSMSEFTMFAGGYYRSSTVDSRYSNAHFVYNILGNNESPGFDHVTYYVRCVRNKD